MRITRTLSLVVFGLCSVLLLHERPAHAQAAGGSSTSNLPKAPAARRTPPKTSPKTSARAPRQSYKPSLAPAPKSKASLPFAPDDPFADRSSDLFEPKARTNAAMIASTGRHQYHADPKSGVYANKSIPQIRTRRGGMRGGMGGMGMGGMGMGGMGGLR